MKNLLLLRKKKLKKMKDNSLLVIIAAAGSGERFGGNTPKQYMQLNGKSVIENSVYPFLVSKYVKKVIIAICKNDEFIEKQDFYNSKKVEFVHGGDTRQDSIKNALDLDIKDFEFVITHDAARPNVSEEDITNLYKDILNKNVSCSFLFTPIYDSIKHVGDNDVTKDKNKFILVQTPQICRQEDLRSSLNKCIEDKVDCPDESYAIEYSNLSLSKIKGKRSNIKITEKSDLEMLNNFLNRSGIGFDLHRYENGEGIILGGCKIDCNYRIVAHSDGDVLLHSIADSILGATGSGDIGLFFSDQDQKNKNLNSQKIIDYCLSILDKKNLEIFNIDTTIICEYPKINPIREQILKKLSEILKIPVSKIGLKATTSEQIGIIGENKAIAVQSLVNLREKL